MNEIETTLEGIPMSPTIYANILETVGETPLVRLNSVTASLPCTVLVKVEFFQSRRIGKRSYWLGLNRRC